MSKKKKEDLSVDKQLLEKIEELIKQGKSLDDIFHDPDIQELEYERDIEFERETLGKTIKFEGKIIKYVDAEDLADQLKMSVRSARKLISDDGDRIGIGRGNNTLKFNIKKDKFRGLLQKFYGVRDISNEQITQDDVDMPANDLSIMKIARKNERGKWNIKIAFYLSFYPDISRSDILTRGKLDQAKVNHHIANGTLVKRMRKFTYNGLSKNIDKFIDQQKKIYLSNLKFGKLIHYEPTISSIYLKRKVELIDGTVRDFNDVYDLTEWCNIEYTNDNNKDSCAVRLVSDRYPELYSRIKKCESIDPKGRKGIKPVDFMRFCREHSIGYNIRNVHSKLLFEHKSTNGSISCILWNGHVYSFAGGKPKKFSTKEFKIKVVPESESLNELNKFLKKKILPHGMKVKAAAIENQMDDDDPNIFVSPIIVRDEKIICNDQYNKCLEYLTKMGYAKYIKDDIRITDIPALLENALKASKNTLSFIPEKDHFKTGPLLWKTTQKINYDLVKTIDKNKCYSHALYSLPYIIIFDYRKNKINMKPTIINERYLYLARPKKWSTYMPCTKLYAGYHLTQCEDLGIEFELLEELECETKANYFKIIIDLMYQYMSNDDFKEAMNVFIGKLERSAEKREFYELVDILNDESADTQSGFREKVGNMNIIYKTNEKWLHVRDRLPIAIQIKDMARMILCEKIREMGIGDEQIVQINTDSISYYGKYPKGLDSNDFFGWKKTEFKEIGNIDDFYDQNISAKNIINPNENTRILHIQYAGAGKTHHIINTLVPRLIKKGISYVVLTPTHTTLAEYKKTEINCEIIQKYSLSNTIPNVDYIIIDEIGFIDSECHDFLYNLNKAKKSFECFGDFNQLLPFGETVPSNQPHYLEYMFNKIDTNFVNRRNNFTKEYYDSLINSNSKKYLSEQVSKYSTEGLMEAECILCYRHETREKYNDMMLKILGFKQWNTVGVPILCTTNKLLDKKIYNHKPLTITHCEKQGKTFIYTLDDGEDEFFINERKLFAYFEPAYAINIHQAQGKTVKSYYWASEDDFYLTGNIAYTIISRLRQKKK